MKKNVLLLLMLSIAIALTAMSWHYFSSDAAGILGGKAPSLKSWLPTVLRIHIGGGMLALLLGTLLVFSSRKASRKDLHKWAGRLYGLAVVTSGFAGLIIAPYAIGGTVSALGLTGLSLSWLYFTGQAVNAATQGQWAAHRRASVFSLALTFSSLTFRLILLGAFLGFPFISVYRTSCWLSWLLHLGVAAWWLQRQTIRKPITIQYS